MRHKTMWVIVTTWQQTTVVVEVSTYLVTVGKHWDIRVTDPGSEFTRYRNYRNYGITTFR